MRLGTVTFIALVAALALAGCGRRQPMSPNVAHATAALKVAPAPSTIPGATHFEGSTGPGSVYALDVPADWNHELVLYAHGIIMPPSAPIGLPANGAIINGLLAHGFAVATSSWDVNGFAVKDGIIRTQQLLSLFAAKFGAPTRTYLMGVSLGSLVALDLAENDPSQFAGCLTVSGIMGGSLAELNHVATVRVLFDRYYDVPGTLYNIDPPVTDFNTLVPGLLGQIGANPQPIGIIAAVMGPRLQWNSQNELVQSILAPLGFQVMGANQLFDLTHQHPFFDNMNVQYAGPLPPPVLADLNANVFRSTCSPDARNYFLHYYEPTGNLLIPLLSIHNPRDPQVPSWHEGIYHDLVVGQGHGDNLLQRMNYPAPNDFGHQNFTADQIVAAFLDLVQWVETGIKPAV